MFLQEFVVGATRDMEEQGEMEKNLMGELWEIRDGLDKLISGWK